MKVTFKIVNLHGKQLPGKPQPSFMRTVESRDVNTAYDMVRAWYPPGQFNIYAVAAS